MRKHMDKTTKSIIKEIYKNISDDNKEVRKLKSRIQNQEKRIVNLELVQDKYNSYFNKHPQPVFTWLDDVPEK
jgi:hypothetical protein